MSPWWLLLIVPATIVLTALGVALWFQSEFHKGFRG